MESLHIKDIDLSEIQLIPQVECVCCGARQQPMNHSYTMPTQEEWLKAAMQIGWRRVITHDTDNAVCCPRCVSELKQIAIEDESAA